MLWRVIEAEVVPTSRGARASSQIVWSPIAQGVLTGKYKPGEQPPAGSRATDDKGGADMISAGSNDDILDAACSSCSRSPTSLGLSHGPARGRLGAAERQRRRARSSAPSRPEQVLDNVKAAGVKLDDDVLKRIDEVLGDVVERDPAKTQSPRSPR